MKGDIHAAGSKGKLTGPTHAAVIYLQFFEKYADRIVTGTDFVSSDGDPTLYPGLKEFKEIPTGCMKDETNHQRQVTDTSAINAFLSPNAFRKKVLGENYFRLTGLDTEFAPPEMCETSTSDGKH